MGIVLFNEKKLGEAKTLVRARRAVRRSTAKCRAAICSSSSHRSDRFRQEECMTLSRSLSMPPRARWLVAIALCAVTGVSAAQDAGTRYAKLLGEADITAGTTARSRRSCSRNRTRWRRCRPRSQAWMRRQPKCRRMLQKMFDQLAAFVAADVPFLAKERADRVTRLRELMGEPISPPARNSAASSRPTR